MTRTALLHSISIEDYLSGEDGAEIRHEYIAGRVYAMTGASRKHASIVGNIHAWLHPGARRAGCQLFANDMKVRLQIGGEEVFYYPDLLLSCDPADQEAYFCSQPCLIIEVLSESTERVDRREKLLAYQTLPSLREYLLVAQDERLIQIHRRACDWEAEIVAEGAVHLDCLDCDLDLDIVYETVL